MPKVDKDPFSSGTEWDYWESHNCDKCVKASRIKRGSDPDFPDYTKLRCAIQREIFSRACDGSELVSQRTLDICRKSDCPFRQEHYKHYPRRPRKNEPTLF